MNKNEKKKLCERKSNVQHVEVESKSRRISHRLNILRFCHMQLNIAPHTNLCVLWKLRWRCKAMRLNQKWFVDSTNSAVWWIKTHIYNLTVIRISVGAYKDAYEHGIECIWLVVFVLSFKALTRQRHAPIFPIITMKQWNQYNHKHLYHQISLILFTSLSMKRCMLFPLWHWQNAISVWARI